jgi:hypothetical protein
MDEEPKPFRSAWLKWGWATAHAQVLKSYASESVQQEKGKARVTAEARYDPKRHCFVVIVVEIDELPERLGLMFGDVVQGYRNALDHLAWELVQHGRKPNLTERQKRYVCFPLATKRQFFNDAIAGSLPGVSRADIAKIRAYQPYKVGKRALNRHPFTTLAKLSNDDKHRTIQPVLVLPLGVHYKVSNYWDCTITRIPVRGYLQRLEVGAEIARIYVRRTGPEPKIEMKGTLTVEPIIGGLVYLADWLDKVNGLTGQVLRRFAEPPEGLIDTIAPPGGEHVFP